MGGTRAVIASLGASISLVAGAALSLLAVSFLFAYEGLTGTLDVPGSQAALLVSGPDTASRARAERSAATAPLVVRQARRPAPERAAAPVARRPVTRALPAESVRPVRPPPATPAVSELAPTAPAPRPADPAPSTGDGVRKLGDAVGSTVKDTGAATAPLGPPVTQAVQDVLDLVTTLLQRTSGALDALKR